MLATTRYSLPAALTIEQGEAPGTFGVVNRDATHKIVLTVEATTGSVDDVTLHGDGDSVSFELEDVRRITIKSYTAGDVEEYPANILILATNLPISLQAAPALSSSPTTPIYITPVKAGTSTSSIVATVTDAAYSALAAANAARLGLTVFLPATAAVGLNVQLGSTGQPTVRMAPGSYYEVPFGWTGELLAKYEAGGSGNIYVTEFEA